MKRSKKKKQSSTESLSSFLPLFSFRSLDSLFRFRAPLSKKERALESKSRAEETWSGEKGVEGVSLMNMYHFLDSEEKMFFIRGVR